MDGIDWQYHLENDHHGTMLYPSEKALRANSKCVNTGGCGVVEVEVRLIRWVEAQNLKGKRGSPRLPPKGARQAAPRPHYAAWEGLHCLPQRHGG